MARFKARRAAPCRFWGVADDLDLDRRLIERVIAEPRARTDDIEPEQPCAAERDRKTPVDRRDVPIDGALVNANQKLVEAQKSTIWRASTNGPGIISRSALRIVLKIVAAETGGFCASPMSRSVSSSRACRYRGGALLASI